MKASEDPISVTAYLRDLVRVFTDGVANRHESHRRKERRAINNCFQLFLGRRPTDDEEKRIIPW